MPRIVKLVGFASICCMFLSPAASVGQKKDANKAEKGDKEKAAEKMISAGQVTGTLKSDGGSEKYIALSIRLQYVEPNPVALLQQQQQALLLQQQLLRAPVWQRQQIMLQYALQMRNNSGMTIRNVDQNLDFKASDDMKVRTLFLPPAFDEKGKPKRYTAKELRELRGDGNLPGYVAEMDALKPGQQVTVYLARPKTTPKPKGKDKDDLEDDKPLIKMIVILSEPREG